MKGIKHLKQTGNGKKNTFFEKTPASSTPALGEKMSLKEIQHTEFEILKRFAEFCELNSLRYYLSGGTLLGAVRHGGFIPWDDDIDIIMPRPDYERFLALFGEALSGGEPKYADYWLCVNEFDSISRIMDRRTVVKMRMYSRQENIGVWIDLFPMDGVPSNGLFRKLHYLRIRLLRDCLYMLSTTPNIKRRSLAITVLQYLAYPLKPLLRLAGKKRIASHINKIAAKYSFEKSELCAAISAGYGLQEVNVRKDFEVPMKIDFEGVTFTTTTAYKTYLTQLYGDYMQLPPESERNKHQMDAWRKQA